MLDKNKIDIISYVDQSHRCLYDLFFFPSYQKHLQSNFNLQTNFIDNYSDRNYFESNYWCQIIKDRFLFLKNYVKNNFNKWAIFSDVDIVFFDNFYDDILLYIDSVKNSRYKVIHMPENHSSELVNGGFFLFFCCEEVLDWFSTIEHHINLMDKPNDQTWINSTKRPKFVGLLDKSIFSCNNISPKIIASYIIKKQLKVFHATCSPDILHKIHILSSAQIINNKFRPIPQTFTTKIVPNLWHLPENIYR